MSGTTNQYTDGVADAIAQASGQTSPYTAAQTSATTNQNTAATNPNPSPPPPPKSVNSPLIDNIVNNSQQILNNTILDIKQRIDNYVTTLFTSIDALPVTTTNDKDTTLIEIPNNDNIINYYNSQKNAGKIDTNLKLYLVKPDNSTPKKINLNIDPNSGTIKGNNTIQTELNFNVMIPIDDGTNINYETLNILRGSGIENNKISIDNGTTWLGYNESFDYNGMKYTLISSGSPIVINVKYITKDILEYIIQYSYIGAFVGALFYSLTELFKINIIETLSNKNLLLITSLYFAFTGLISIVVWLGFDYNGYKKIIKTSN